METFIARLTSLLRVRPTGPSISLEPAAAGEPPAEGPRSSTPDRGWRSALKKGQSFLELALVLPILILMLLGLLEVVIFIGRYLDILDMTREAARFASLRDFKVVAPLTDVDCRPKRSDGTEPPFHFYYQTSCLFSPPQGLPNCNGADDRWCNGVNSFVRFNHAIDDIVISVYTVSGNRVSNTWPQPDAAHPENGVNRNGYWAFSDNDTDDETPNAYAAYSNNWQYDCSGIRTAEHKVRTAPYYNYDTVNNNLGGLSNQSIPSKGFVAVELYYCYNQVLNIPVFTIFVPNPVRIHAYTLMPLPASAPTPTPRP